MVKPGMIRQREVPGRPVPGIKTGWFGVRPGTWCEIFLKMFQNFGTKVPGLNQGYIGVTIPVRKSGTGDIPDVFPYREKLGSS